MHGSSFRRRRLRAPAAVAALALSFGTAFAFGHSARGEPAVEPARAAVLTVAGDLPAIPALAVPSPPPALAKPVRQARSRTRHRAAAPARPQVTEERADPAEGSPAPARPAAPRPVRRRAPTGGGHSTGGGGDSGGGTPVAPVATPAPVQVAPAPVEVAPAEEPEEEAPPEEEG